MENHIEVEEKKQDKGFTLVELLIVIVILGILAAVTVFAVRGLTTKAETNSCKVEQRAIETAFEAFFVDNNQTDAADMAALVPVYLKDDPTPRWTAVNGANGWDLTGAVGSACEGVLP